MNRRIFEAYVETQLAPTLEPGDVVILDNLASHKSEKAKAILKLRTLDPVDADHTAAWKGTAVHNVLEAWLKQDDCDPATLVERARRLVGDEAIHPMLRALWQPRLIEAVQWIADQVEADRADGRKPLAAELMGRAQIAGVELYGKVDRIDRMADGSLAIIDYKTGQAPSPKAVAAGFAEAAGKYLTGEEPFTAKLHPAHAPYGDYDQLMRLEEWYGRD